MKIIPSKPVYDQVKDDLLKYKEEGIPDCEFLVFKDSILNGISESMISEHGKYQLNKFVGACKNIEELHDMLLFNKDQFKNQVKSWGRAKV